MFPILQLGPLALYVPALALLAGVWVGAWLVEKEAIRLGLHGETISTLVFIGLVAGLIGARLWYVAHNLGAYAADPIALFSLSPATLTPAAGLLIGIAAAGLYGLRRMLPPRTTLDALAPGLATMLVAIGCAHLASGDGFGEPAQLPWSIFLWDADRHPSQVYEIVGALIVLGAWWRLRGRRPFDGFGFLLVVALSAAARLFLEAFRGDSALIAGGLRAAQVGALLILALCLIGMDIWGRAPRPGAVEAARHRL
ncbi:MAG TPA: prolipoprotein diacylglyceryl transferase family protein [Roseiflexaceae bacterium]